MVRGIPKKSFLISLMVMGVLAWIVSSFLKEKTFSEVSAPLPAAETESSPVTVFPEQQMGDQMLAAYASENSDGQQDIQLFFDYLKNVFLLMKSRDTHQYAINEDLADFLRGKNDYKTPYLSSDSHIFDADQMIIDRWGSPIHIHTISRDQFELRSAGPDKKLFTEDDFFWPHPNKAY